MERYISGLGYMRVICESRVGLNPEKHAPEYGFVCVLAVND